MREEKKVGKVLAILLVNNPIVWQKNPNALLSVFNTGAYAWNTSEEYTLNAANLVFC